MAPVEGGGRQMRFEVVRAKGVIENAFLNMGPRIVKAGLAVHGGETLDERATVFIYEKAANVKLPFVFSSLLSWHIEAKRLQTSIRASERGTICRYEPTCRVPRLAG